MLTYSAQGPSFHYSLSLKDKEYVGNYTLKSAIATFYCSVSFLLREPACVVMSCPVVRRNYVEISCSQSQKVDC